MLLEIKDIDARVSEEGSLVSTLLFDAMVKQPLGGFDIHEVPERFRDLFEAFFKEELGAATVIFIAMRREEMKLKKLHGGRDENGNG